VANHSPTPTPVGYPVDRLLGKPGCSWFPAGQPGAGLGGRTGSLRLWPSRQPGSTDDARHQTIAHFADPRLGIPEFGLGLGTFLPGWRRWSLRRCTPSTRPRRRADLTSGHHSGGGSDRNGQALRQTRTPVASGAAATTPTTPVSLLTRRIPDRKGVPFGAKKSRTIWDSRAPRTDSLYCPSVVFSR